MKIVINSWRQVILCKIYYANNYIVITMDVCKKEIMVNENFDFLIHKIFQKN